MIDIDKEKIREAVLTRRPTINYSWLSGFFLAEGSLYLQDAKWLHLNISQKLPGEVLYRIQEFLNCGSLHLGGSERKVLYFHVTRKEQVLNFFSQVFPQLIGDKRRKVENILMQISTETDKDAVPIDWPFVTGFWEGDGFLNHHTYSNKNFISFVQKDLEVLEHLQSFLSMGTISECDQRGNSYSKHPFHRLCLYTESDSLEVTKLMFEHCIDLSRRTQLALSLDSKGLL